MVKRLLFIAFLAVCGALPAVNQVTVFGTPGKIDFSVYPLLVNRFEIKKGETLANDKTVGICDSLANSKFLFFPTHPWPDAAAALFGSPAIRNAMTELLKRGGIIYIGHSGWTPIAKRPAAMTAFFDSLNVRLPTIKNYLETSKKGEKEKTVSGVIVPEYRNSLFNTPNNRLRPLKAICHFGDLSETTFKPLVQTADGKNLMVIQENVCGKGKIVVSYCTTVLHLKESDIIENILTGLYGSMRKISRREQLRQAAGGKEAVAYDLSKVSSVELSLSKDGAKPKNPAKVRISGDRKKLILEFFCTGRVPPVSKCTGRDGAVWKDDCVEVLIGTSLRSDARTYQFIVNSANTVYDACNGDAKWDCKNFRSSVTKRGNDFYVKMELPVEEFKLDEIFRLNLGREQVADGEITSWAPAPIGFSHISYAKPVSFTPSARLKTGSLNGSGQLRIMQVPVFTRIHPDSVPGPEVKELKNIKITLPRNDLELTQIVFYNTTEENYIFRIEPELGNPCGDIFSFRELFNWRASIGEVFSEIETPLNPANLITVPGGECKVLLLAAKTLRKPGRYTWSFQIVPVNVKGAVRKVSVTAEVLPLTLDEGKTPPVYGFGPYAFSWLKDRKLRRVYWKQLKAYHVNNVMAASPRAALVIDNGKLTVSDDPKLYVGEDETFLAANIDTWHYGYGVLGDFRDQMRRAGIKKSFRDPEMLALFEKWIANWAKALKAAGMDFNRFYVPIKDEPFPKEMPDVLAAAEIVRKYGFKVNMTLTAFSYASLDDLRRFASVVDLVLPWEVLVLERPEASEMMKIYRKHCKIIMPYLASRAADFSPLQDYFRFRGIRVFLTGADGIALWTINGWHGNDYRSSENNPNRHGAFWCHHGDERGLVPTFRMEAFREGVEDLYYLRLAAKSSSPAVKALIAPEKLRAVMNAKSPAVTAAWHEALLKALAAAN